MSDDRILEVEHLTHALRRPRRRRRSVVRRPARRDHRADRPERRRQDHRVQLHHRLLQAERRHDAPRPSATASAFLLERLLDFRIAKLARVARTFQNIRLFAGMTVLENLVVAQHNALMRASGFTFRRPVRRCRPTATAEKRAIDKARYWLDRIGLLDARRRCRRRSLAYGEQRRLEIARAMCTEPVLLCLDEPAAGLNARESAELNDLLLFIREEHGTSILLIEHDMWVVMEISDHIVVLDYGVKIADGTPQADPRRSRR